MANTYTYDPKQVSVLVFGVPIAGYADGTFVSATRNEDTWSTSVGSDGEVIRVMSNNRTGRITLTLTQSSLSNLLLSSYAEADEVTRAGVAPVAVRDQNGRDLALADAAWIVRPTNLDLGSDTNDRVWLIDCATLKVIAGGLSKTTSQIPEVPSRYQAAI